VGSGVLSGFIVIVAQESYADGPYKGPLTHPISHDVLCCLAFVLRIEQHKQRINISASTLIKGLLGENTSKLREGN
jgi:energy-converting hydrogenase Eha subunit C